ncbi:hypothetical protein ABK040_015597 [Willaertia magna]
MKLYVHDEVSEITKVITWNDSNDLVGLKTYIEKEFGLDGKKKRVEDMKNDKGKKITALKDKMDIFITIIEEKEQVVSIKKEVNNAKTVDKKQTVGEEVIKLSEKAMEWFKAKQYKKSIEAFEELKNLNIDYKGCINNLGTIYLTVEKYDKAIQYLEEYLKLNELDIYTYSKLGQAYYGSGRYKEALNYFYNAAQILEKIFEKLKVEKIGNLNPQEIKDQYHSLKVHIGKCLIQMGDKQSGFSCFASVLKENEQNKEALMEYGKYLFNENNDSEEVINVMLRVLVKDQENREAKSLISKVIKKEGTDLLLNVISQGRKLEVSMAPAIAWIALIVKEHSCIDESVKLYREALKLEPSNISHLLNLVHTLEIDIKYAEALIESKKFCENNLSMGVGGLTSKEIISFLNQIDFNIVKDPIQNKDEVCQNYYSGQHAKEFAENYEMKWIDNYGSVVVAKKDLSNFNEEEFKKQIDLKVKGQKPYTQNQLDFIALACTIVKMCYISGFISILPNFIAIVEKERMKRDLHTTQIRNEQAYLCTISQLLSGYIMKNIPVTNVTNIEQNHIFMLGESHCLSPAYQTIKWNDKPYILLPKIVTGCKCYHLRNESDFYPKRNFVSCIKTIPKGSTVIFMFGEIDCREGIWAAIEKLRYKNIQEGISTTLEYYMNELKKHKDNFNMFIHPAPPVIDITRETVLLFNINLKAQCMKHGFKYLDFVEDLLTNNISLKKELILDGTHMNSNYVKYLEKALNNYKN